MLYKMKKKFLVTILVLISAIASSQSHQQYATPDGRSHVINHQNGKCSIIHNTGLEETDQFRVEFNDNNHQPNLVENLNLNLSGKGETLETHHLTLHFDEEMHRGSFFISSDTDLLTNYDFTWSSDYRTAELDIPENTYDIVAQYLYADFNGSPNTTAMVFLIDIPVTKDVDTTISFQTMAKNELSFECYDENDVLIDLSNLDFIYAFMQITIDFPEPYEVECYTTNINPLSDLILFSDIPLEYSLLLNQFCYKQGKMYIADLVDELNGICSDTLVRNHSEDYKNIKIVPHASPSSESNYLTFAIGLTNIYNDGSITSTIMNINPNYPSFSNDTVQAFLWNPTHNINGIWRYVPQVVFWENIPSFDEQCIRTDPFYVTPTDSIAFSMFDFTAASNIFPDDGIVDVGNTTPFFSIKSFNNMAGSNTIFNSKDIFGQLNEKRIIDLYQSKYEISLGSTLIHSGILVDFNQPYTVSQSGMYTFSITNENSMINDFQCHVSLKNNFDLNSEEANPPVISSFKLMDSNGFVNNTFGFSDQTILQFSCYDGNFILPGFEVPASIEVFYKKYYDTTWSSLVIVEHPEWYTGDLFGYFYSCDLSGAFSQFTGSGYADLKIVLKDGNDNTSEQIWHPAAYVTNFTQYENDMALSAVISPFTGEDLGLENVTVWVKNVGTASQTDIPIHYKVDDEEVVCEVIPGTILPGDSTEYTFVVKVDLSAPNTTTFTLQTCVDQINDENNDNDFQYIEITNYVFPKIYIDPTSFQQTIQQDTVTNDYLLIANNGNVVLEYDLKISSVDSATSELCTEFLYILGCDWDDGIIYWDFNGISTDIFCEGTVPWYHDFTNFIHDFSAGETYTLELMCGTDDTYFDLWIDFNNDMTLTEDEVILDDGLLLLSNTMYTFDVEIPSDAQAGCHVMRIRTNSYETVDDPCEEYFMGNCCDFTANIGPKWLSADIYSGSIESGQSQDIMLMFSSDNMESGYYQRKIIINSNDPNNLILEIPVSLIISEGPWPYIITDQTHTIDVPVTANPNIFGEPLKEGDWVGVFFIDENDKEVCGGAAEIDAFGEAVVTAYGNDVVTTKQDGFAIGESFKWKIYNASNAMEYLAVATYDASMPNQGNFADLGQSKLTNLKASAEGVEINSTGNVFEIYPNPTHDELYIKIINMENDLVSLSIFNSHGEKIVNDTFSNKINLNMSTFPSGIYFLKLQSGKINEVRKFIIK
jgi:Secretion system C-terminal sorting domain/GEVED domain